MFNELFGLFSPEPWGNVEHMETPTPAVVRRVRSSATKLLETLKFEMVPSEKKSITGRGYLAIGSFEICIRVDESPHTASDISPADIFKRKYQIRIQNQNQNAPAPVTFVTYEDRNTDELVLTFGQIDEIMRILQESGLEDVQSEVEGWIGNPWQEEEWFRRQTNSTQKYILRAQYDVRCAFIKTINTRNQNFPELKVTLAETENRTRESRISIRASRIGEQLSNLSTRTNLATDTIIPYLSPDGVITPQSYQFLKKCGKAGNTRVMDVFAGNGVAWRLYPAVEDLERVNVVKSDIERPWIHNDVSEKHAVSAITKYVPNDDTAVTVLVFMFPPCQSDAPYRALKAALARNQEAVEGKKIFQHLLIIQPELIYRYGQHGDEDYYALLNTLTNQTVEMDCAEPIRRYGLYSCAWMVNLCD